MSFQWMTPYHVIEDRADSSLQPMSEFCRIDPDFSVPDLQSRVSNLMIQLMFGMADGNLKPLKPYMSDSLLKDFTAQAEAYARDGRKLHVIRPSVLRTEVLGYRLVGDEARVRIRIQTRSVMYTTDQSGRVIGGSDHDEYFEDRIWEFARALDVQTGHIKKVDSQHCPSCGAPMNVYRSAVCSHCGSLVRADHFAWSACAVY